MKRSAAPSLLYAQKKQKLGLPDIVPLVKKEEETKGRGRKKQQPQDLPKVNHLDLYNLEKFKSKDSDSNGADSNGSSPGDDADVKVKDENRKGRNVVLQQDSPPIYYLINYKNTTKSDDPEGVGILEVDYGNAIIHSIEGRQIGRTGLTRMSPHEEDYSGSEDESGKKEKKKIKNQKILIKKKEVYIQEDFSLMIGNKLIKIIIPVEEEEYKNGSIFLKTDEIVAKKKEEKKTKKLRRLAAARRGKGWVVPFKGIAEKPKKLTKPLHNPNTSGAVVLFRPTDITSENNIAVVVDPILGTKLRPHQVEGVQFMFDCLLGFKGGYKGNGCILADDMGLGKTIQALTILWTLLKQGPAGEPVARKAIIVAPTSLVGNWCKEIKKWLGDGVNPVAIGKSTKTGRAKLGEFQFSGRDVLVISYDQLRIYCEDICKIPSIGLIICDEGHRLKNAEIKTTKAVSMIPTPRRVILSGTPIQNDLTEFYAMVNFVNPGVLKNGATFKNVYDTPILESRKPEASEDDKRLGKERSLELTRLTSQFILRRTAAINTKYLPPKTEYTVFCKLSDLQKTIYNHLIKSVKISFASTSGALPLITTFKKLTNSPELIYLPDAEAPTEMSESILKLFPKEWNPKVFQPQYSGKLQFLDKLLSEIRNKTKDKVVIISNYTQTLGVLGIMCKQRGYPYYQLDGSTPGDKRQLLVDKFNEASDPSFIFLLSSKAGGVGLNIIGANHLVLFDSDWNPANDAQAMARVWREGQKKNVSIYRTLTTGTIEEKIYQRQITKMALSVSVVEGDMDNAPSFETKELKDLFSLKEDTICDTHDMLACKCAPSNRVPRHKRQSISINELSTWDHYHEMEKIKDPMLAHACKNVVTFVFANSKGPMTKEAKQQLQSEANNSTTTTTTTSTAKRFDVDDDMEAPFEDDGIDYEADESDAESD
eukprot:gene6046-7531_t